MTNKKTTTRALVLSILSLLLCVCMLAGTTLAWFTDTVTTGSNVIKTGTLDAALSYKTDASGQWVDAASGAIFEGETWEPGFTQVRYIRLSNEGSLPFRFKLSIVPSAAAGAVDLAEVIEVRVIPAASAAGMTRDQMLAVSSIGTLADLMADPDGAAYGVMVPVNTTAADFGLTETVEIGAVEYCVVLHMKEAAGNEYQGLSVGNGFAIQLDATQLDAE